MTDDHDAGELALARSACARQAPATPADLAVDGPVIGGGIAGLTTALPAERDIDGGVLEGPAVRPLGRRDPSA